MANSPRRVLADRVDHRSARPRALARPGPSRLTVTAKPRLSGMRAMPPMAFPLPPPPASQRADRDGQRARTGLAPLAACLLPALLLLALAGLIDPRGRDGDGRAGPTASPTGTGTGGNSRPGPSSPGTPGLAGPAGDEVRVRPLDTIVVVSPAMIADPASAARLRQAITSLRRYITRWGMTRDRLAVVTVSDPMPTLRRARSAESALRRVLDRLSGPAAVPEPTLGMALAKRGLAVQGRGLRPGRDSAVILLDDPSSAARPSLPVEAPPDLALPIERRPPVHRGYLVTPRPGSGLWPVTPSPPEASPVSITTDPLERGALAEALARAWVDATTAAWGGPDRNTHPPRP